MPYNFVADIFSQKETLWQTFFQQSAILDEKWQFCVFEPEPTWGGGLGVKYDDHLKLSGKRTEDFLLVLIELFR